MARHSGTMTNPEPPHTRAIEPKTKWGVIAFYVAGALLLGLVNLLSDNNSELLLAILPDQIEWLILPLVPAAISFAVQFNAQHQWRSTEVGKTQAPGTSGVNAP